MNDDTIKCPECGQDMEYDGVSGLGDGAWHMYKCLHCDDVVKYFPTRVRLLELAIESIHKRLLKIDMLPRHLSDEDDKAIEIIKDVFLLVESVRDKNKTLDAINMLMQENDIF